MKRKIAITSGIGSGKSTLAEYIRKRGYPVFSCDAIYREIFQQTEYVKAIEEAFPSCVQGGRIDKNLLAARVFSDEKARKRLNSIAHPLVMKELMREMERAKGALAFAEVPLLFEGGYEGLFDDIFVVLRDYQKRIEAICERDTLTPQEAKARIATQFDYDDESSKEYLLQVQVVLFDNNGTPESLALQFDRWIASNK